MTDDEKVTHESEHECPLPTEWPEQPKDATARLPYCKVCGTIHILLAGKGWHKIVPVEQHYSPPSAPHGDGGGVVNPESAEGASPMTPEEPCWLEEELGAYGKSRWFMPTGALCLLNGELVVHIENHNACVEPCKSVRPCPACRVRELEAEVERWKDTAEERLELLQCGSCIAILFHGVDNTDCPSHDRKAAKACGEVSLSEVVQDSAEVARLRPVAEKATLEAELAVRGCWLCGDTGRAVKWEDGAALETDVPCPACRVRELEADIKENYQLYRVGLRVEKDCIEELEAEVTQLREALDTERLAALIHDEWVSWSKGIAAVVPIPPEQLQRWQSLWVPYNQLSHFTKDTSREWARKVNGAALKEAK